MFKAPDIQPPTAAVLPPAPANPPMFGEQASKGKKQPGTTPSFNPSVLGSLPTNTANKTLLGQ